MAELAQRRSVGLSNPGAWIGHVLDGEKLFGYVLVAPAIIYIVLLVGYPGHFDLPAAKRAAASRPSSSGCGATRTWRHIGWRRTC